MRIVVALHDAVPFGGQDRFGYELARGLARTHDVHLVATRCFANLPGVTFHPVPVLRHPILLKHLQFFAMAGPLIRDVAPDRCLAVGGIVPGADTIVAQFIHAASVHAIQHYHPRDRALMRLGYNRLESRIYHAFDRMLYARARRVVAVSRHTASEVEFWCHVAPGSIRVVPNGFEPATFHARERPAAGRDLRSRCGWSQDASVSCFVGALERKGLGFVLDSMAQHARPSDRLVVVGAGRIDAFRGRTRELGLDRRVAFLGGGIDTAPVFRGADCCWFPTLYEPFGMVGLEALACGCHLVVSNVAGVAEWPWAGETVTRVRVAHLPADLGLAWRRHAEAPRDSATRQFDGNLLAEFTWNRVVASYAAILEEPKA